MPATGTTILVLSSDIEMMRSVLMKGGFDKKNCSDQDISMKAAHLVMTRFRHGMLDPDELLGELLFCLGKHTHCRSDPPSRLPKYAIQGLPTAQCCPTIAVADENSAYTTEDKSSTQH